MPCTLSDCAGAIWVGVLLTCGVLMVASMAAALWHSRGQRREGKE